MAKKRIAWLVPALLEGSGGHRTIFQNAAALVRKGYACDMYLEAGGTAHGDAGGVTRQLKEYFGVEGLKVCFGFDVPDNYDLAFATVWYSAKVLRDLPLSCPKAYFVQDFEATFNPAGDGYLMAENSYRFGHAVVTIGRWLSYKLQADFGCDARFFDFCADRSVYRPLAASRERAVCCIYQPEKPRRCPDLAAEALGILSHRLPDVTLYLYGSRTQRDLWFPHRNLGMLDVAGLNDLYNRCQVGLCISSTNPSRIPFEMMATGLPVVDIYRENNLYDFPDAGMLLADSTPEALAEAMVRLLETPEERQTLGRGGAAFMAARDLESGYAQFAAATAAMLAGADAAPITPDIAYQRPPVLVGGYSLTRELRRVHHDLAPVVPDSAPPRPEVSAEQLARAELVAIESTRAWRLLMALKNNALYRAYANWRIGPGWEQHGQGLPPTARLAFIKNSNLYRLLERLRGSALYRGYMAWKQRRTLAVSRPAAGKVLSLDLWDTVLRRRCHPDEVKLYTARQVHLHLAPHLAAGFETAWSLCEARVACERAIGAARREAGDDDEYAIEAVFAAWLERVLRPGAELDRAAWTARLVEFEVEQEGHVIHADPGIQDFVAACSPAAVNIISDFYMGARQLQRLLLRCCPWLSPRAVLSSCDVGLNKRSGRLFEHYLKQSANGPEDLVHAGDNRHSDVEMPRSFGLEAVHYICPEEEEKRAAAQQRFATRRETLQPYVALLAPRLAQGSGLDGTRSNLQAALYRLGRRYAPLYCGMVLFAMEAALRRGVRAVHYFTREGEFLRALHQQMESCRPVSGSLPRAELLEVSRLATFLPSLRDLTPAELMRLWNLYSTQTLRALCASCGVAADPYGPLLARHGLALDEPIEYPWQDARVQALLADPAFRQPLLATRDGRRELLKAHLADRGLTPDRGEAVVVDIGWRGTIQDSLAYVLPDTTLHGCYFGLQRFLNEQPANTTKQAFGPDENREGPVAAQRLLFVAPFEMLANSDSGSVTGYEAAGDAPRVRRVSDEGEDRVFREYTVHFQQGVASAVPAFCDWVRTHALSAGEIRPWCLQLLDEMILTPPRPLAEAFFSLSHNETFGVGEYVNMTRAFPYGALLLAPFSRERARAFCHKLEASRWPQGFLAYHRCHWLTERYNQHVRRRLEAQAAAVRGEAE